MMVLISNKGLPRLDKRSLSFGDDVNYRDGSKVLSDLEKKLLEHPKAEGPECESREFGPFHEKGVELESPTSK